MFEHSVLCSCSCVCVCKQVASFPCCIKVSSLSAPQEKQRAGGSLGRSALPWATYQTAWMSVDVCRVCVCVRVCARVCVFTECKGGGRKSGWLSRLDAACLYRPSNTVIVLNHRTITGWSGWEQAHQLPADNMHERGSTGDVKKKTRNQEGKGSSKSQKVLQLLVQKAAAAGAQLVTAHFCRLFGKCLLWKVRERGGKEADRFYNSTVILAN